MQGLLHAGLLVEGHPRVHLRAHAAGHDLKDLAAKLHQQVVQCSIDLLVNVLAVLLAILARIVDELGVLGLLGCSEDEGRVGGGVLRLVLADGREVARVADDGLKCDVSDLLSGSTGEMSSVRVAEGKAEVDGCRRAYRAGGFELIKRRRHDCCVVFECCFVWNGRGV